MKAWTMKMKTKVLKIGLDSAGCTICNQQIQHVYINIHKFLWNVCMYMCTHAPMPLVEDYLTRGIIALIAITLTSTYDHQLVRDRSVCHWLISGLGKDYISQKHGGLGVTVQGYKWVSLLVFGWRQMAVNMVGAYYLVLYFKLVLLFFVKFHTFIVLAGVL